jgi:prophage tail gpP-like protein
MIDDLILEVNGLSLSGWNTVRVTRGIERCPNDFSLTMTERFTGELAEVRASVQPGDSCIVRLGSDLVISGYVERFTPSIGPGQHAIEVGGRGRCSDLVDCAAEWPGGQIVASSALGVAQKLCEPYGIEATCLTDPGVPIPKMVLNVGETPFEIIERVCRFSALLAYEGPDGNLVLSRVGTAKAASGFKEGVNVESASIAYSSDQQFSEYQVVRMSMDTLHDAGDAGNLIETVKNPNIKRHRRRVIVAEGGDMGSEIAKQRAQWECSRRFGRAAQLRLTTDGWRDSAGALYMPNTLADVALPTLKAPQHTWLISEVTYRRDDGGTACDVVIMPPEAFQPEPVLMQQGPAELGIQ